MSIQSEITRISGNITDSLAAVEDMGGTVPSGATSNNLAAAIRTISVSNQLSNPNLLDNPWFTVNQRGQSSYTRGGFCVDRWRMNRTDTVVVVGASGITINSTDDTNRTYLEQKFDKGFIKPSTTYTLSVLFQDGTIKHGTATTPSTVPTSGGSGEFANSLRLVYSSTHDAFHFIVAAASTVNIAALKLEYGSTSTLANDHEPDYVTELNKCRYYYERIYADGGNLTISTAPAFSTDTAYFPITIAPKRVKPTLDGYANLRAGTTGFGTSGMSASAYVFSKDSGILTIEVRKTGAFTQGSIYRLGVAQGTSIELSAEL